MDFLKVALENLPQTASSPLAFAGYVLVIVAWFLITWRVRRHHQLLKYLEKIPDADRLEALRIEMGAVTLRSGLSAEQWIRSRTHLYLFLGFSIIALLVLVLIVLSVVTRSEKGSAQADVTVYEPGQQASIKASATILEPEGMTAITVDTTFDRSGIRHSAYDESPGAWDLHRAYLKPVTVTYGYQRQRETVVVRPKMPFLELYVQGGPVRDSPDPVWQFPLLSLKIVNNTPATLLLSELAVKVKASELNTEPILRPVYTATGSVIFVNEGWGKAVAPKAHFALGTKQQCIDDIDWSTVKLPYEAKMPTADERLEIPGSELLGPDKYWKITTRLAKSDQEGSGDYCTYGVLSYKTPSGDSRELKFQARGNIGGLGGGAVAQYFYELWLPAGKAGYINYLPLSQSLKPGESDHFVVRVGTDKSARFDLEFSLRDTGGAVIPVQIVDLEIFVPRTFKGDGKLVRKGKTWKAAAAGKN